MTAGTVTVATAKKIPVLEVFGPTVQGEGMVIGRKTMFVRTAGCDYRCAWCDSAFTWDGTGKDQIRMLTVEDVEAELRSVAGEAAYSHVTLSGGNPALLGQLGELVDRLHVGGVAVGLETQGSRWQDWFLDIDELTLSPKPPSSGMDTNWDVLDDIVKRLRDGGHCAFSLKVVVFNEADLQYALKVHRRYSGVPFYLQSGNDNVKEQDTASLLKRLIARYEWLVETVTASAEWTDVRVLPQLHAWLWGNKRGV